MRQCGLLLLVALTGWIEGSGGVVLFCGRRLAWQLIVEPIARRLLLKNTEKTVERV